MDYPKYSVAIRTLGTAGDKFVREINSLLKQSILPEKIFAYIPDGYAIPEFSGSDVIVWVRSPKGMVSQRSLPFLEISSQYVLFLDDDIELAADTVENLFKPVLDANADVVVANVFPNHEGSIGWKIRSALGGTLPSISKKWAFRIRLSTHYSYCNCPEEYMPSQSGAGACILCRFDAYRNIHFEEERWLEFTGYPLGEDLVFLNKFYRNSYKVMVHFNTKILHLDGGAGTRKDAEQQFFNSQVLHYLIWYRISYQLSHNRIAKAYNALCFYGSLFFQSIFDIPRLFGEGRFMLTTRYSALRAGIKYRKSGIFDNIPLFNSYKTPTYH